MGSISIVKHPPSWPQGLKERKRGKREQRGGDVDFNGGNREASGRWLQ